MIAEGGAVGRGTTIVEMGGRGTTMEVGSREGGSMIAEMGGWG